DCPVSSPARLADVVRGDVELRTASVVREFRCETARRGCRHAEPSPVEPIPPAAAPVCAGGDLRIPFHDAGGAPQDREMVEARAPRDLVSARLAGGCGLPRPARAAGLALNRTHIR